MNILKATKPLLYETGMDEWPYSFAGTCFPLKFNKQVFILSAKHCYTNHKVDPKDTLYPTPLDHRTFYAFDSQYTGRVDKAVNDLHTDFLALRVASEKHSGEELHQQAALDVADAASIAMPLSPDVVDVWLRGYPTDCPSHGVDYDKHTITYQAYTTNGGGVSIEKSTLFDYCYWLGLKTPIPEGLSSNGMSGSPLYGVHKHGNRPVFMGLITWYHPDTKQYLFIGSEVIVNLLRSVS